VTDELGLLCVHAHPDDEAISTGGVLARYAAEGVRTAVVTCTGGERGEVVGEGMDPDEVRPRLSEVRRAELDAALAILGAGPARWLGYVDSGMMGTDGNADPRSFWQANMDDAVRRLVGHFREFRPDVVVTYDAFGVYGHPDHLQTHRVGLLAAEASAVAGLYPDAGEPWRVRKVYLATIPHSVVLAWHQRLLAQGLESPFGTRADLTEPPFGTPDEQVTTVADVVAWLDPKRRALAAHASQIGPDSFFLNIPDDEIEAAFGAEWFIRHRSDVDAALPEDDLFAGLRGAER